MQKLADLIYTARCMNLASEQRHAAFGQLVELFQGVLYARALRVVRDRHLAQDITQETLLTAYQQLPRLRQPEAFPMWINQILRTHCNRQLRRHKTALVSMISLEADGALAYDMLDPAVILAATEIRANVLNAIATLPEHQRVVVHLFYLQDLSLKEIAERLKLPLTTIKKRLQYARMRLRTQVSEMAEGGMARFQASKAVMLARLLPRPAYSPAFATVPLASKLPFPKHGGRY